MAYIPNLLENLAPEQLDQLHQSGMLSDLAYQTMMKGSPGIANNPGEAGGGFHDDTGSDSPGELPPTAPPSKPPTGGFANVNDWLAKNVIGSSGFLGASKDPSAGQFINAKATGTAPDTKPLTDDEKAVAGLGTPKNAVTAESLGLGPKPAGPVSLGIQAYMPSGGGPNKGAIAALKQYGADVGASDQGLVDAKKNADAAQANIGQTEAYFKLGQAGVMQAGVDAADELNKQNNIALKQASDSMVQTNKALTDKMNQLKDVDPEHWWNTRSTGQKIASVLGVALGAFGAGMPHNASGGHNWAMEMMNNAINDDIDSQKANLNKEWNKITKGMEINKDEWAKNQWLAEQRNKEIQMGYKKVDQQLAMIEAQSSSATAVDRATLLRGKLADEMAGAQKGMFDHRLSVSQSISAEQAKGQGGGLQATFAKDYLSLTKKHAEDVAEGKDVGELPSPEEYFKMRSGKGSSGEVNSGKVENPLKGIPKELHDVAKEEIKKKSQYEQDMKDFKQATAKVSGQGFGEGIGKDQEAIDLKALNSIIYKMGHQHAGARTPEATEHMLAPLMPSPWDTQAQRQRKMEALVAPGSPMLGETPSTPVLDQYGKTKPAAPNVAAGPGRSR